MFKAKSFLVALCTECIWPWAIFTIVFILFLHFWLSWCPRDNIYKATFVRTHVSTSLVALIQSKCHSPTALRVFYNTVIHRVVIFLSQKTRSALPPELACRCHIQVTAPTPKYCNLNESESESPASPDRIYSRTHLKLSLNMHFF